MNRELFEVFTTNAAWFTNRFGAAEAEHHLFPFGKPMPSDPTRPITDISSAWDSLRDGAGVKCRLHDMRHTVATKMAEAGTPESTMLSLLGHMSSAMLERYSHIRMTAKRTAVETL
jgi:integrase